MEQLPTFLMDTVLMSPQKKKLATYIRKNRDTIEGSFGILHLYSRTDLSGEKVVIVKRPKYKTSKATAFYHEALLQKHIHRTLKSHGFGYVIPEVYDIFQEMGTVGFSMEYIYGENCIRHCLQDVNQLWPQLVFQVALYLYFLQDKICFDHRDLKYNNVWIRKKPVDVKIGKWSFKSSFQVILLDFGFACLGDKLRNTVVNLGDGTFDIDDKCPKEGRDMFQFIVSFWAEKDFRDRSNPFLQEWITEALTPSYANLAARMNSFEWSYLLSQKKEFSMPHLEPGIVLEKLIAAWPHISN